MKNILRPLIFIVFILLGIPMGSFADDMPLSVFSLKNYDQHLSAWLNPKSPNYNKPLVTYDYQLKRTKEFYQHLFNSHGVYSPWAYDYIKQLLSHQPTLHELEKSLIQSFSNQGKDEEHIGYGENYRPHTRKWIKDIAQNMNVVQFVNLRYHPANRAIATANLQARVLPTNSQHYYKYSYAGQGFPFDNLQMSAVWVGTPVYILGHSQDSTWDLVATPSFIAWVPAQGIAKASQAFIDNWSATANHHMATIIHTDTPIFDANSHAFLFTSYVGAVFPAIKHHQKLTVFVPVKDLNGHAQVRKAEINQEDIAAMPLLATPHNFSRLMSTLIHRSYGWGGMFFDNDCSQELRSIYAAFGIWLPRHSSEQVKAGKLVDKSKVNTAQRINYLMQHGHSLMTLVYINGHVFMYLGNYLNPNAKHAMVAMTYQNIWGLAPASQDRRAVIGQAVLLPLLKQYPEDPSLASLADRTYFRIVYLDQWSSKSAALSDNQPSLRSLIYPVH